MHVPSYFYALVMGNMGASSLRKYPSNIFFNRIRQTFVVSVNWFHFVVQYKTSFDNCFDQSNTSFLLEFSKVRNIAPDYSCQ